MSEPLTPERLAEIRERWSGGVMGWRTVYELVDEVERLRTWQGNAVATVAVQARRLDAREREHNADRAELERVRERNEELGRRYMATARLHKLDQTGGPGICGTCRQPYPCPTLLVLDKDTERADLPKDLPAFTEAVIRAVATIPGVRFAGPVSDQDPGWIGVKVTATDDATYFVQVTG
ncbi:hypothetical protein [Planobispora rosea]|uniref:hypothetical protein n=1 Tax=Planobispora rosea TaxID=35762 RepID=UPI00083A9781|nr:hypothetical protein [Planobispora rosea]